MQWLRQATLDDPERQHQGATRQDQLLSWRWCKSVVCQSTSFAISNSNSIGPANGAQLKLWQCYDNIPAQQWYYTDDDRIALDNQGMTYVRMTVIQVWLTTTQASAWIWMAAFWPAATRYRPGHVPITITTRSGPSESWYPNYKQLSNTWTIVFTPLSTSSLSLYPLSLQLLSF